MGAGETRLEISVRPGSKTPGIEVRPERVTLRVRERAVDGAANRACVRALAAALGVPPSRVRLLRGESARLKLFAVDGMSPETALARLDAAARA